MRSSSTTRATWLPAPVSPLVRRDGTSRLQTENLLLSNNSALAAVARDMVAGKSGTARVPFGDGEKYVAYAP